MSGLANVFPNQLKTFMELRSSRMNDHDFRQA